MADTKNKDVDGAMTTKNSVLANTAVAQEPVHDAVTGEPVAPAEEKLGDTKFVGDGSAPNRPEHLNVPSEAIENEVEKASRELDNSQPFAGSKPETPVEYR